MALVHQFVAFAIKQDAPIPWQALLGWMLRADARSAVGRDGVIPARFVPQSIKRMDVFKETLAGARWRNGRAVKVDILLAVVCAQADHVALIGRDVDEFELSVEPTDSRVGLTELLSRLDGEAERRRVSELEAGDGMRDPGRAPVIDRKINAGDLRDPHGTRLPTRCIVGLGPVVAVAYVVQRYFVALNVCPRFLGHVRLPVAIVGRRKRQPPCKHATKKKSNCAYFAPERPNEYQRSRGCDRQESSHNLVRISEWSVKPYGAECPGNSNDGREKNEQPTDPANQSHQIGSSNFCYNWFHNSFSPNCRASVSVDWRFTDPSRRDASDTDGKPVRVSERERTSQTPYRSVFETAAPDEASPSTATPAR